jgi:hypothetical protein
MNDVKKYGIEDDAREKKHDGLRVEKVEEGTPRVRHLQDDWALYC